MRLMEQRIEESTAWNMCSARSCEAIQGSARTVAVGAGQGKAARAATRSSVKVRTEAPRRMPSTPAALLSSWVAE